jgi:hypothetical protein
LNIDVTNIHNVYNTTVVHNETVGRVSYNGGEGGVTARPTAHDQEVQQQRHIPPVAAQTQHVQAARSNPQMRAEANQGKPPVAATSRAGEFSGGGVVAAKAEGAPYKPAPSRSGAPGASGSRPEGGAPAAGGTRPEGGAPANTNPTHAKDLQPHTVQTAPSSGDPRADLKYQQQQQKLADQQNTEHQKLQQQQEKEDQQAAKQSNQQKQQQVEQRHQQQTQQLEQKHTQQQQQLQSRQPAPRPTPRKP